MNLNQFSFVTKLSRRALNMQVRKKNECRCDLTVAIRYKLVNFIRVRFMQLATASHKLNARIKRG